MSATPDFDNASLWDVRRDVVVFDEHYRPEKTFPSGKKVPARDFKKPDLEKISRNCNERDAKGLPCAVVIGHTTDSEDETEQPEMVGYDRNFRVEYNQKLGKYVILADRYLRRERAKEAEQYPRTSVEHWINQDFFDPIAIVKRTPKCDIPQWHYTRKRGEVDRYTLEGDMDGDPTQAPDAAAVEGDLEEKIMKCVMQCLQSPEVLKMLAGGQGMPGPTNGAAPAPVANDAERFASEAEKIRYTRQQEEIDRLKKESEEMKSHYARAGAEATVKQLLYEGYDVGGKDEKDRAARTERMVQKFMRLDTAGRKDYEEEIRECYQRAPVGGDMLHTYAPDVDKNRRGDDGPTEKETLAATRYMRQSGKNDFDEALKHIREKRVG